MRMELLEPRRVRRPRGPYGWVELKVVTGGFLERLASNEALTYLFLCTVGNALGLSFWSTNRIGRILHLQTATVTDALEALVTAGLIAWNGRVVQVLPLPSEGVQSGTDRHPLEQRKRPIASVASSGNDQLDQNEHVDIAVASALEPEAREQLGRFLGTRQPSVAVVQAVAKGLARQQMAGERPGQLAKRDKGRAGS